MMAAAAKSCVRLALLAAVVLLLNITAHSNVFATGAAAAEEGDNDAKKKGSSFAKVDGRRMVVERFEEQHGNNADNNADNERARNSPLMRSLVTHETKRPCKRLFTSIFGQATLAQFNRDSGNTNIINFYDKPFVNTLEYDFLTDTILGLVNGTVLADVGHQQAHVRLRGDTGASFMSALTVSSYGEVFGYSPIDTSIYELDKFTGRATSFGETGLELLIDMAYWFQADLVFATDGDTLFVIDIINRALGEVGPIQGLPDGQRIQAIVITPQGTLFGITDEFEDAALWEIDKFTGEIDFSRAPVVSSLPSLVFGGTLRCPVWRLPPNAFPPREPTPSPDGGGSAPTSFPAPAGSPTSSTPFPTPFPTFDGTTPSAPTSAESWNTDIDLDNVVDEAKPAFEAARDRWDSIVTEGASDIPDVSGELDPCTVPTFIDDLWICAFVEEVDGPGGVLAFAGPVAQRSDTGIPFAGLMGFDVDDIDRKIEEGELEAIVLHEMAHVFGYGTLWTSFGLADSDEPTCNYSEESVASAEYQALSGCFGEAIPLEQDGGPGTECGHWDEECFIDEIMTGFISGPSQPLSTLTIASFEDMGYAVDYDLADPYGPSDMASFCLCLPTRSEGVTEPRVREPLSAKGYNAMVSAGQAHLARMAAFRETWESTHSGVLYVGDKVVHVLYEDENGALYKGIVRS